MSATKATALRFCLGCFALIASARPAPAEEPLASRLRAPLVFCKRFNYQGLHIYDTFYQWRPGGGIYVLENPTAPPAERRIRPIIDAQTPETLGEGIYFDPSLSYDAKRLLFCFKGTARGNSVIYEIGTDGKGLRQITDLDASGNPYRGSGGGHHDVKPCYLPDGRIVFTSTRYSGLVPCANNGVAILHVMNPDGSGVHTISVNNVTEFDPAVLPDGRILFGRWEYVDRNALVIQSLWTVLPDGRNEMELFANNMVFPEAVLQAKPVPGNDHLVVATFAPHNAPPRGTIAMVDTRVGRNDPRAITNLETPERPTHDRGESCDPWALSEELVLYSGVPDAADAPAIPVHVPPFRKRSNPKLNALMLIDRSGRRELLHSDPEMDLHNPIPLAPRPRPQIPFEVADPQQTTGQFFVNNVYASLPGVRKGSVRWLRVLEETSRVTPTPGGTWMNQTFSISAALAWSAKIYHGVVPVEADGSCFFEAPAGRALYFQLLDDEHRLVRGMRTFIQAVPGATRSCVGCHEYTPPATARYQVGNRQPERLRDESWGSGYLDYTTRVQPLLDANCVACHGGAKGVAAGIDLSRGWTEYFNISYEHLTARRERMYTADLIGGICAMNGTAHWSCRVFGPYSHGSGKAPLADILLRGPHKQRLRQQERELLFAWMDSNGAYFGSWDYTPPGPLARPYQNAVTRIKDAMVDAGCARCHADQNGQIRRFDQWINLDTPEMSWVLRAPLPPATTAEGGYGLGLCRDRNVDQTFSRRGLIYGFGYAHAVKDLESFPTQTWPAWPSPGEPVTSLASTRDPHYIRMLRIIQEARAEQLARPRIDMPTAELVGDGIVEGAFRQILPQPLPEPLPALQAAIDDNGFVRIAWEASARTAGLITEIHRGTDAAFTPGEATCIGRTRRSSFLDRSPPDGPVHYAAVFVSNAADACAATGNNPTVAAGPAQTEQTAGTTARCPLSTVVPQRTAPVRASLVVPGQLPPLPLPAVKAAPGPGRIVLQWEPVGVPGLTEYDVHAAPAGAPEQAVKLNDAPLRSTTFMDVLFHGGREVRYTVLAHASRRAPSPLPPVAEWATCRADEPPLAPVLELAPGREDVTLRGAARFEENQLCVQSKGCAVLPATKGPLSEGPFSFVLEAFFEEPGQMPVLLGFGQYRGTGWFLQKIGGRWRFHLSGESCDGGTVPIGEWVRVVGVYDGRSARLYQNGEQVAETPIPRLPEVCRNELYVGQYSARLEDAYQFRGRIRRFALYHRLLDANGP